MFLKAFRKYCDFQTRSNRHEFWGYLIPLFVIDVALLILIGIMCIVMYKNGIIYDGITEEELLRNFGKSSHVWALLSMILACGLVSCPAYAVATRRLHDTGKSAWWLLINIIPVIGHIWFLILMLFPGEKGENQWGPASCNDDTNQIALCGHYYKKAICNYFNFIGKATIEEYFGFSFMVIVVNLCICVLAFICGYILQVMGYNYEHVWKFIYGGTVLILACYGVFLVIPALTLNIRRLRDTKYSPWLIFLLLIGNIGTILVQIFSCQPSKKD